MLYATQYHRTILVIAADSLMEFEDFALSPKLDIDPDQVSVERADILDMIGNANFNGFTIAPVVIECSNDADVERVAAQFTMLRNLAAIDQQAEMVERAKLEAEADLPPDRRTLAEVHGLTEHDPWDNSNEKQKEAGRKQDEQMKAIREAGGLTGDSFAGKVGDKLNINSGTVYHDEDGAVIGADIKASKSTIKPYELAIDGDDQVDFDEIFDELKIPENRIMAQDGNTVTLLLHDFQTGQIAEVLDRRKLSYTLSKVTEDAPEGEGQFAIDGHEEYQIFYSVQIDQATIHEIVPALEAKGFDTSLAATMRNVGRGCWLAFSRETTADECAKICHEIGHACAVVAINRQGQSILGEGVDARVIDTNTHVEIGPRPWNDRAAEIDAMSDEERAELRKSVQASEYLMAIDEHPELRTVVYIVPESYFRETGELWTGEMILDMLPKEADTKILTEIQPGIYRGGLEAQLLKDNMCRWGFVESLLLRIHINDLLSEQRAAK